MAKSSTKTAPASIRRGSLAAPTQNSFKVVLKYRAFAYTDTIQVFVGDAEPVHVPAAFMLKIEYLANLIQPLAGEKHGYAIHLPEHDRQTFDNLLGFPYLGESALAKFEGDLDNTWDEAYGLYRMAAEFEYEHPEQALFEILKAVLVEMLHLRRLERMTEDFPAGCSLLRFCAADVTYRHLVKRDVQEEDGGASTAWVKGLMIGGDWFGVELVEMVCADSPEDPRTVDSSAWHTDRQAEMVDSNDGEDVDSNEGDDIDDNEDEDISNHEDEDTSSNVRGDRGLSIDSAIGEDMDIQVEDYDGDVSDDGNTDNSGMININDSGDSDDSGSSSSSSDSVDNDGSDYIDDIDED